MSPSPLDVPLPRGLHIRRAVQLGRVRRAELPATAAAEAGSPGPAASATDAAAAALQDAMQRAREEGLRSGREEGLRQGFEEGRSRAEAEVAATRVQAIRAAVEEATEDARRQRELFVELAAQWRQQALARRAAAEDDIAVLCFETVCRVLGLQLATAGGIRAQVARLLEEAPPAGVPVVRVQPADLQALQAAVPDGACRWIGDPEVALGGCIVELDAQVLDARLETVLAQCKAAFGEERGLTGAGAGDEA